MDQEQKRIEKMVSDGIITKAEAEKLLAALHHNIERKEHIAISSRLKMVFSVIEFICVVSVTVMVMIMLMLMDK
jgi:hypothetical protein